MKKYIPDFITSMNIACGAIGVVFAFKGRLDLAFWFMLAAAVFDFCDGFAARALDAYSDLGKELDSLCDCVSFGLLPAAMLYNCSSACLYSNSWASWTALAISVFSAIRLAKFNVDPRQLSGFIGLPTPADAMLIGAICVFVAHSPSGTLASWMSSPVFVPVISAVLCFLLVCEIPMFSLKFHKDDPKPLTVKRIALLAIAVLSIAACLVFKLHWSMAVIITLACYIVKNIVYHILKV